MRPILLLMTAVAALAGCAESATQVDDFESNLVLSEDALNRVVASTSGSGHSLCTPDGTDCMAEVGGETLAERYGLDERDLALRTFSFTAQLRAGGTARGKAQFNNRGARQAWDIEIECVLFRPSAPNQVWMLGRLTRGYGQADSPSGIPYAEGVGVLFAVEDNGEGSQASPDRMVGFATVPEPNYQAVCPLFNLQIEPLPFDFLFAVFGFDAIRGNIQVRPPSAD